MATLAEKRRAKFELELNAYSVETYNAPRIARALGKPVEISRPICVSFALSTWLCAKPTRAAEGT